MQTSRSEIYPKHTSSIQRYWKLGTQRLQCSLSLVVTSFLLRDYNRLRKLHRSVQVHCWRTLGLVIRAFSSYVSTRLARGRRGLRVPPAGGELARPGRKGVLADTGRE